MSDVLVNSTDSVVNGTSGDDHFVNANGSYIITGNHTLVGGAGNDYYAVEGMGVKVVEQPGSGVDWITSENSYVLPANVENLTVWGSSAAFGNDDGNTIFAQGNGTLIDGGKGDDVLWGGTGTRFQFEAQSGNDTIAQWSPTSILRVGGYAQYKSFGDIQTVMKQVGADVVVQLDASDSIRLQNTKLGDLTASNFQFHLDASKLGGMTFDDEFNSLSTRVRGGATGTWDTEYGYGATSNSVDGRTLAGNGEKELYVDPTFKGTSSSSLGLNPFSINNGVLTITEAPMPAADKAAAYNFNYTSGVLTTRESFAQTYGYFEAKMEVPAGQGTWPAFWLVRQDGTWPPELDVLEEYGDNTATETIHTQQTGTHTSDGSGNYVPNADTSFHTYGVLWTPTTVTWYIDGAAVKQVATPADMNSPMYMIVNNAVTSGTTDPNLTSQLKVDYVRAYSLANVPTTVLGSAAIHGGAYTDGLDPTVTATASATAAASTPVATTATTITTAPASTTTVPATKGDHGYWGKNPALADGFNFEYYAAHNPDVVAAGVDLHTHYLKFGKAEGRLAYDPDAMDAATVALTSHGYWGAVTGVQDGFNAAYYAAHNPDVVKAGLDLLTHYETYGKAEGRLGYDPTATATASTSSTVTGSTAITSDVGISTPAPVSKADHGYWGKNPALADGFNADYYAAHNPDVVAAGVDLHTHYLKYGKAEGRLAYDPDASDAASVSAASHGYWGAVTGVQDGFNAAYYAAHNPDVVKSGMDLLTHYETYGKAEGRLGYDATVTSHAYWGVVTGVKDGFNAAFYAAHNLDVVASGMDLLTHYETYGKAEGRLGYDPAAGTAADGTTAASYKTIAAYSGNATLAATSASDTFVLTPGFKVDTVTNFDIAHDKLDVATLLAKYGTPTLTDMDNHAGTTAHWSGGETVQLLGVSHTDAQHALGF